MTNKKIEADFIFKEGEIISSQDIKIVTKI